MKIAVFYNLKFSGAKRTVQEHVKGLKKLGNEVDVYTLNKEDDIFSPEKYANDYYSFPYQRKKINIPIIRKIAEDLSDFIILKKIHKKIAIEIDGKKYDFVLVHTDYFTQAPFILRFLKTKNAYFCLEPLKIGYEYGFSLNQKLSILNRCYETINRNIRKNIDRTNARSAKNCFAISLFGRELMISSFDLYPKVSYLGIDPDIFKKTNIKKKNQVLFVGQKLDINGYHHALDAVSRIPQKIRPSLKVLSIGKGKKISDKELVKLYGESIATLCLSNFDTFGLVTLESMACGTPVIAFNVAGYREIVDDSKNGFLVNFSVSEIQEKIIQLSSDKDLVKKMGENGAVSVKKNWTWDKQIRLFNEDIKSLI